MTNSNTTIPELRASGNIAEPHWRMENGEIRKIEIGRAHV